LNKIDVIKLQALIAVDGTASTTGFGDTFAVQAPEPDSATLSLLGAGLFLAASLLDRRRKSNVSRTTRR
jgi:hypothetical protein